MKKNEIFFFKIVSDDSMKKYNFLQIKANSSCYMKSCTWNSDTVASKSHLQTDKIKKFTYVIIKMLA